MNIPSSLRKTMIGAAVATLALASVAANAHTISQTIVTPANEAPWGDNLSFNKFDPSIGTLTGVQINFRGFGSGAAQVTHGTGAGSISMDELGSTTQITAPGLIALTKNDFTGIQVFAWPSGSQSPTNFATGIFGTDTINVINQSFWSAYTGSGTFNIALDVKELITWDPQNATGDFDSATFKTYGGADVTVIYNYTPEPGSLALLALGGMAVGFARRQRKS